MTNENRDAGNILQRGYAAARRDAPADMAGWCDKKEKGRDGRHGGKDGAGAPGRGPVAPFGLDDEYVATFDGKAVTVTRFEDIGRSDETAWRIHARLDFETAKAHPAGAGAPLLLYIVDSHGAVWSLDFRPREHCPAVDGIAEIPRCQRLAHDLKGAVRDIVVLRRTLVL